MLSWCRISPVILRAVTSLAGQTPRHVGVMKSRQICWTKKCSVVRLSSSAKTKNTRHENHQENLQPKHKKNVSQNIHPSAQKKASSKFAKQKEIPFSVEQSPHYIKSSFDDTFDSELENQHKEDKIPSNHSLIYIDTFQRNALIRNTCSRFFLSGLEVFLVNSLYQQWQSLVSVGQDPFSLSNLAFLITAVAALIAPFTVGIIQLDSRKRILRIYRENDKKQNKYIAVKTHWVFWTKQQHFTGKDIKYMQEWETSIYGLVAGNVTINRTRCRVLPDCFREFSGYNEFLGFVPTSFQETK
ncbi:uncharacterized protein LOC117337571 isoform X2 [Pecten maximus]|nr:uncharacterized protein LOC117337571 isoform X2 [Pecten maximus]